MTEDNEEKQTNENTEYEKLAQEIYKGLLMADGLQNINVQHNVKLPGKSGCAHQIDVYWEVRIAGVDHKVAIETKNFTNDVSIAKVRDFFGVIHDIGNITGIFATKKGFQKGAKQFADYYGIQLKEIRQPADQDWEGKLKTIMVDINIMPIEVKKISVNADLDWFIEKGIISSADQASSFNYALRGMNNEIFVYDREGNVITNFLELTDQLPHDYQEATDRKHVFEYKDGYLDSDAGRVKINAIQFVYDIKNQIEELVIDADNIVKAIIKDVKSGEIKFVNNDGSIR